MNTTTLRKLLVALLSFTVVVGGAAFADPEAFRDALLRRPAGAEGTVVVPDHFLRRWDPVTVFFTQDLGPSQGGPEDDPKRLVKLSPKHPGAYTWLDARTLQFRPAEPWPPLAKYSWRAGREDVVLTTLMAPPIRSSPDDGAADLDPVESITLTFSEPIAPDTLSDMLSIELRALPGVGDELQQRLTGSDFEVKAMERSSAEGEATYVLGLDSPIPLGTRATLRMRLALDDQAQESVAQLSFSTAEPFRATRMGCSSSRYPVTPEGTRYSEDQALACGSGTPKVVVDFSAAPTGVNAVQGRNLVHFSPAVSGLSYRLSGRRLEVSGDFERERLYKVTLAPTALNDGNGRSLEIEGESSLWLFYPRREQYLRLSKAKGISERRGPKRVPIEGRGHTRADLRIYPVDPLDRSLWPFPDRVVNVDESARPPSPGEEPEPYTNPSGSVSSSQIAAQLKNLGSPPVSAIVDLPLSEDGSAAAFGLDLQEHLKFIDGAGAAGHYLVGLRALDGGDTRSWMRLQVTDLALTTIEEPSAVRFVVTSLATGRPVSGAKVRVEGSAQPHRGDAAWTTLSAGTTNGQGVFRWDAPGADATVKRQVRRIVVDKGDDTLVLDASQPPETYANNHWSRSGSSWLQWAFQSLESRAPKAQRLAHVFTERPIYKPGEEVHIRGYLRDRLKGELSVVKGKGQVVVQSPGDQTWRTPVTLSDSGAFYHRFQEDSDVTGTWFTWFEDEDGRSFGRMSFLVEAYRLPRFEVDIQAQDTVHLDGPFQVGLTASYYAGGRVAQQPVRWRVSQYPSSWSPKAQPGFLFSSDGRYSDAGRFESGALIEKEVLTDNDGGAKLVIDPSVEISAQPRSYVIEATVTGADDQTVTATHRVQAVPSFALGLKIDRYVEQATSISPQVIAVGHDDALKAGVPVTLRLLNRQWHSHLQASDFSEGAARYVTDVVDELVSEQTITTTDAPLSVKLPLERAGVYVVELEARDALGRAQTVRVDLYAGGDEPVSWQKPGTPVFEVSPDHASYAPGETANLVIRSPFQQAQALVIVETPNGNEYSWLNVRGGSATVKLPIKRTWVPRLPVHVVLMRGRVNEQPRGVGHEDMGKPQTMASTTWLTVDPVENTVKVALEHEVRTLPGSELPVTVKLADPKGRPLSGEVTLWLVDAAVLALAKEQRLDPLPDFITPVRSVLKLLDTRNLIFGSLPFSPMPGGDGGEEEAESPLDKVTVRKNFKTVPYYKPDIRVPASGTVTVKVPMPDNLTNFKVRAKATSGEERFGYAKSQVAVRLPVIVQPSLPRFVRPTDRFDAVAIGRIVEGEGGAGSAEIKAEGVTLQGDSVQKLTWDAAVARRIAFPVAVGDPGYTEEGELARDSVRFTVGVKRSSDGAGDAFQVDLPLLPDRDLVVSRVMADLKPGEAFELEGLGDQARPGTFRRSVVVSDEPAFIRMAAGMQFLLEQPYGCTEQRMAKARALLALGELRDQLQLQDGNEQLEVAVKDVLERLPTVIDDNGLVAYWPGSRGYVSLTSWTLSFLREAEEAGFSVDPALLRTMERSLKQSLRSDYRYFISGESWAERAWALRALAANGSYEAAYFAELSRSATWLEAEGVAQVVMAGVRGGQSKASVMDKLVGILSDGVILRLFQGREIYSGLKPMRAGRSGVILPSETRALASITRAIAAVDPDDPKLPMLKEALVNLGRDDGWGNTNTNASAMMALSELLRSRPSSVKTQQVTVTEGDKRVLTLDQEHGVAGDMSLKGGEGSVLLTKGDGPVIMRVETRYVPEKDGSFVEPSATGFVVSRELLRQLPSGPAEKIPLEEGGGTVELVVGQVIEEHVQVVNPEQRYHVAVTVPLAAGMEPMNPNLATSPPEARPSGSITRSPSYAAYSDDSVTFFYDSLPKGTFDFYFRTRASTPGSFVQPAAQAQLMYDFAVKGNSPGLRVEISQ